ncbi:MAG: undecaprenyl-diphosphate phosphatase [Oligoflexia bacterium]|nr:undecaprenyl-diphosphate phosphatase [Oligoflexia bacterium]
MDILFSVIYGIIQGLTEFLPVSSSGHLALLPKFFSFQDPGVVFDLSMHLGTAFAVIVYFRKDLISLIESLVKGGDQRGFAFNLIFSTFISFIAVLLLKGLAAQYGRSTNFIAINLIVFGAFMFFTDRLKDTDQNVMNILNYKTSFLVGLFQAIAIFPGVSRSGITISIARMLGVGREEASRFSFLLSLPIIIGGFVFKIPEFYRDVGNGVTFDLLTCLIGIVVSFITGLITIHYFLKFIKEIGLSYFFYYRIILALVIFAIL